LTGGRFISPGTDSKCLFVAMADGMGDFSVFSRTGSGNRRSERGEDGQESKGAPMCFFDENSEYRRSCSGDN
jgi:hypothetical protein